MTLLPPLPTHNSHPLNREYLQNGAGVSPSEDQLFAFHQTQSSSALNFMPTPGHSMPGSPKMAPLTTAQRDALTTYQHQGSSSSNLGSNTSPLSVNTENLDPDSVAMLDTSQMSPTQLRQLASQMRNVSASTSAELRRQMHIQCEQKRRRHIRCGFDALKDELPTYMGGEYVDPLSMDSEQNHHARGKKLSKAIILNRALDFVRRMKTEREWMARELERLRQTLTAHGIPFENQAMQPMANDVHVDPNALY